jgi:hypothetical protein
MRRGRPGLMGTMARTAVIAGTATAVSGSVSNRQQQKQMAKQQQAAAAAAPPPAPAPAPAAPEPAAPTGMTDDKIEQLTKLGQLRDAGILTDEEFAEQKAKILNS